MTVMQSLSRHTGNESIISMLLSFHCTLSVREAGRCTALAMSAHSSGH